MEKQSRSLLLTRSCYAAESVFKAINQPQMHFCTHLDNCDVRIVPELIPSSAQADPALNAGTGC